MRKLASIQIIKSLNPIPGADKIEKATVLGWQLVVKKNEFKVGDLCVYCEIDSILPPTNPMFAFLQGKRIKTVKLKGQVSQGIAFPISVLTDGLTIAEDYDVTEPLGVTKYEPPEPGGPNMPRGNFPFFIPKTDETRVQVLQHVLDAFKGTECYVTEKLDGSSITMFVHEGRFGVASRNMELHDCEGNKFWDAVRDLQPKALDLYNHIGSFALQGELIGPGIQKDKYNHPKKQVFWYSLFYIYDQVYASLDDLITVVLKLDGTLVPILDSKYVLTDSIPHLVEKATGNSVLNGLREGIVIRSKTLINNKKSREFCSGGRDPAGYLSFKVINPKFLLRHDDA